METQPGLPPRVRSGLRVGSLRSGLRGASSKDLLTSCSFSGSSRPGFPFPGIFLSILLLSGHVPSSGWPATTYLCVGGAGAGRPGGRSGETGTRCSASALHLLGVVLEVSIPPAIGSCSYPTGLFRGLRRPLYGRQYASCELHVPGLAPLPLA